MMRHLLAAALVFMTTAAQAASVTGDHIHVRDADTIVVNNIPVRFNGVNAAELRTAAGKRGKAWLTVFLRGKTVTCELTGAKTYDRYVGTCFTNGQNLSIAVISAGHGLDCKRYSGGRYKRYETAAAKRTISVPGYCR